MIMVTRPSRVLALPLLLTAALAFTGCGGSTPTATPTATAGTPATGGINIGQAASALNDLDNYRFKIVMASKGSAAFTLVPQGGSMTMEGAIIFRPDPAADLIITTVGGQAAGSMMIRIVGDMSYVNLGSDQWMASQADDAQSQIESYKPDKMLGSYASVTGLNKVGDEDKNGVATEHYRSTEDMGLASMFGLPDGSWAMDIWVAKAGGFVVASKAEATAKAGAEAGSFSMTVDVLAANDPTMKIEAPENVMVLPS